MYNKADLSSLFCELYRYDLLANFTKITKEKYSITLLVLDVAKLDHAVIVASIYQ